MSDQILNLLEIVSSVELQRKFLVFCYLFMQVFIFNFEGDSINERVYSLSNTKLVLTGAWPCHIANIFKPVKAKRKLMLKWRK